MGISDLLCSARVLQRALQKDEWNFCVNRLMKNAYDNTNETSDDRSINYHLNILVVLRWMNVWIFVDIV